MGISAATLVSTTTLVTATSSSANMVGLHDSPWQTHGYVGDIYLYYGSHGCVNTPYEAVRTMYYSYPVGTPVVVY